MFFGQRLKTHTEACIYLGEEISESEKKLSRLYSGDFDWHVPRREKKVVWLEKNKLDRNKR